MGRTQASAADQRAREMWDCCTDLAIMATPSSDKSQHSASIVEWLDIQHEDSEPFAQPAWDSNLDMQVTAVTGDVLNEFIRRRDEDDRTFMSSHELMKVDPMIFIGRRICKFFDGHGFYGGTVAQYDSAFKFFRIVYEDGDKEEMVLQQLQAVIVPLTDTAGCQTKRKRNDRRENVTGKKPRSKSTAAPRAESASRVTIKQESDGNSSDVKRKIRPRKLIASSGRPSSQAASRTNTGKNVCKVKAEAKQEFSLTQPQKLMPVPPARTTAVDKDPAGRTVVLFDMATRTWCEEGGRVLGRCKYEEQSGKSSKAFRKSKSKLHAAGDADYPHLPEIAMPSNTQRRSEDEKKALGRAKQIIERGDWRLGSKTPFEELEELILILTVRPISVA